MRVCSRSGLCVARCNRAGRRHAHTRTLTVSRVTEMTPGTRIRARSTVALQYSWLMPSTFILIGRARLGLARATGATFSEDTGADTTTGFTAGDRLAMVCFTMSRTRSFDDVLSSR